MRGRCSTRVAKANGRRSLVADDLPDAVRSVAVVASVLTEPASVGEELPLTERSWSEWSMARLLGDRLIAQLAKAQAASFRR